MSTIDSKEEKVSFYTDHNAYILGAGFSQEAGYPLISNFMEKMREATQWLEENHYETKELNTVLELQKDAAKVAHVNFDPENIEDLFSLFAATDLAQNSLQSILVAILEIWCRYRRPAPTDLARNSSWRITAFASPVLFSSRA